MMTTTEIIRWCGKHSKTVYNELLNELLEYCNVCGTIHLEENDKRANEWLEMKKSEM